MREEGQVELLPVETPNGLSASATLANGDRQCQYYFYKSPLAVREKPSAFHPRAQRTAFRRRGARQQSKLFVPLGISG
jgi:hypothetical protein